MKKITLFLYFILSLNSAFSQGKSDKLLVKLLKSHPEKFGAILKEPEKYRVQIIYTQIDRDKANIPHFKTYRYRLNKDEYFYPASTVKFPVCLLALEKLNQLNIKGLSRQSPMQNDSVEKGQIRQYIDPTNTENYGLPSLEHYIKKILLVSDNDAFNRLYEFMGQEAFNETLYKKGYKDLRIVHRLSVPFTREQNKRSNPVKFLTPATGSLEPIYTQPMLVSTKLYEPKAPIKMGKGYMVSGKNYYVGDSLVNEPFDFTYKNYFALDNQQAILKACLFPESVKPENRFNLKEDDYGLLYKYMSMSPLESSCPAYPDKDSAGAWDSYCKFLMFGDSKAPIPKNIRIFNKVGDAYGFLLDNAYIVDFDKKIEFMLTAVIYCNSDGIFNDDKYDYETIGFPFMAQLGKVIYDFEMQRNRKFKPDLSRFKMGDR
jgi:Beta-lactamase enzyme family